MKSLWKKSAAVLPALSIVSGIMGISIGYNVQPVYAGEIVLEDSAAVSAKGGSFQIPYGNGEDEYTKSETGEPVTEDFVVLDDHRVAVLDATGRKILIFEDGIWSKSIPLCGYGYAMDMEWCGGYLYVLDYEYYITRYDVEGSFSGETVTAWFESGLAPIQEDYLNLPIGLETVENELYVELLSGSFCQVEYCADADEFQTVSVVTSDPKKVLGYRENCRNEMFSASVSGILSDVNVTRVKQDVWGNSYYYRREEYQTLQSELPQFYYAFVKTASDGSVCGVLNIDSGDWLWRPVEFYHISNEDTVYVMSIHEDYVKIEWASIPVATAEALWVPEVQATENYALQQPPVATPNVSSSSVVPADSITRNQVITNAMEYVSASWKLQSFNRGTKTGVTIPSYISAIAEGDLPKSMTGVPYCWGGTDTVSAFKTNISNTTSKYLAGNVDTKTFTSHVSGTAGVDCSGFASRCYGISRVTTSAFNSDTTNTVSWNQLCKGDYLSYRLNNNGHVVLFYQYAGAGSTDNLLVIDSSTSAGKVAVRTLSKEYFLSNGYTLHTAWTSRHTSYDSAWQHDSQYHYHKCNICQGMTAPMTHKFVSGKCSVCGRLQPVTVE